MAMPLLKEKKCLQDADSRNLYPAENYSEARKMLNDILAENRKKALI